MTKYRGEETNSNKESRKKEIVPEKEAAIAENCRCKEVAKKTPREMLGLMIRDLAFWKKQKGSNPK